MTLETLESLQLEYDTKLKDYNQLSQDYKQLLQSGSNDYVVLKDKTYAGTSILNTSQVNTINLCQASCSSNSACSGASYTPDTQTCTLSTGNGGIQSSPNMYAIITNMQNLTGKLKEVNNQLIVLNKKIQDATAISPENNLDNWVNKNNVKHAKLIEDYNNLVAQRDDINKLLQGYNNVNENMKDTSLEVNQQMIHYRLHTIILAFYIIYVKFYVVVIFYWCQYGAILYIFYSYAIIINN